MREVLFIARNTERWKGFEKALDQASKIHPDELADLYIDLADDLAYARTFYPESQTVRYLNSLASNIHQHVYLHQRQRPGRLLGFWRVEYPLLMYRYRRFLWYSFLFFGLSVLIGAVSAANDDRFVRLVLGDDYVNMTLANIDRGDPMAVYKQMNPSAMFLGITYNNVQVMFLAYVAGVFASYGTVFVLFRNGVMLGSFQYFFHEQGVLYESILSIWIHGTIEIFAIVVSGAAGLVMGNRLLFPGTYPRLYALQQGARTGLKIVFGLVPFVVLAGFLEGFVTRQTQWPDVVRIGIIAASAALIVFYFFWYPRQLWRQAHEQTTTDNPLTTQL